MKPDTAIVGLALIVSYLGLVFLLYVVLTS